jgi:4-hydroxyphenylpyruvate dioxygenase
MWSDRLAMTVPSNSLSESTNRESISPDANPLGLSGIEFIEYATSKPQALGQVLEMMGFRPVARHRSREVLLYRQGDMNIIINAHASGLPHALNPTDKPVIAALGLRVRDAAMAYTRALELGAWGVPTHVEVMELNIPAIHGVGSSRIYFIDRVRDFSIYDVDFIPIPSVDAHPSALAGFHFFGLVQYIGNDRMLDWMEFYQELLGFQALPLAARFGILPKGRIMKSPCNTFFLQLIEPEPGVLALEEEERFQRVGLGCADVQAATALLSQRGVEFVTPHGPQEAEGEHHDGALTRTWLSSVSFELVGTGKKGQA